MEKVKLTKAEALPKMRAAFEAGILCKQRFPHSSPKYRGREGAPCVVGAALDDETARRLDAGVGTYCSIGHLIRLGAVETDDNEFFKLAQDRHDQSDWEGLRELLGIEA